MLPLRASHTTSAPKCVLTIVAAVVVVGGCARIPGCGLSVGEPCKTTGSGFHASQPCRTKCIDRWSVACPDGRRIQPGVCAGAKDCNVGECPSGQLCYHFDDPFEDRSYCLPADVCGALREEDAAAWERAAEATADQMRAEWEAKKARRSKRTTQGTPTAPSQ